MDKLIIQGPIQLRGEIDISGAKNAALPILMATLLTDMPVLLLNIPHLQDITTTLELLRLLGAHITIHDKATIEVNTNEVNSFTASYELVKKMRASILALGALLGKYGKAKISLPGGCAIGARPVDQHLKGIEALGAVVTIDNGYIQAEATNKLRGTDIILDMITVTGTENILMAAILAQGRTIIRNAAREPEVSDLANFLNSLGAHITGIGTDTLVIDGVAKLHGGSYRVIPDRIEAGTYLAAGALTRGKIKLNNITPETMIAILEKFSAAGAEITLGSNWLELDMHDQQPRAVSISTSPYPGFPTDMQAQLLAMNTLAQGTATIVENIFENRFMHIQELRRLGADIALHGNTATIIGKTKLVGAPVMATDLRASASLVLAALMAEGQTTVDRIYHIDRGYEFLERKLAKLGAHIQRISS